MFTNAKIIILLASPVKRGVLVGLTMVFIVALLHPAEEKLGREVNSVVYPIAEFKKKVKEDHYFVTTVLDDQKIFLVGDQNTLQKLSSKNTVLTK